MAPIRDAVPDKEVEGLWGERLRLAKDASWVDEKGKRHPDITRQDRAAEFVLRYRTPTPHPDAPECPPVAWPALMDADDLRPAVHALLQAHAAGELTPAALDFLAGVLLKLAKVIETADLAPQIRELQEHVAAMQGAGVKA